MLIAATAALVGCSAAVGPGADGSSPPPDAAADVSAIDAPVASDVALDAIVEPRVCGNGLPPCGPAEMCEGPPGCGTPWHCVAAHGCTPDVATFCDCNGFDFHASSSCPGRPYMRLGSCVPPIVDGGPTRVCRDTTVDQVRAPTVLFAGDTIPVTTRATSGVSCSCTPSLEGGGDAFGLQVCGCCDACACIDGGYEVGAQLPGRASGSYNLSFGAQHRTLYVLDSPTECTADQPTAIRVVGPDGALRQGGAALWWVVVSGAQPVCCGSPLPAVRSALVDPGTYSMELLNCLRADCDLCASPPPARAFEEWHSLGVLGAGSYVVQAGALRATFTVP